MAGHAAPVHLPCVPAPHGLLDAEGRGGRRACAAPPGACASQRAVLEPAAKV